MNVISRFFLYYEQVRLQMHREVGEIFDYEDEFIGLKMLAELIYRMKLLSVASFLIPPNGMNNILTLPSGEYRYGFKLDNKLQGLKEKDYYLLALQYEAQMGTGDSLLIKIDEAGTQVYLYLIHDNKKRPVYLTGVDLVSCDFHGEIVRKLYKMSLAELGELQSRHLGLITT